MSSPDAYQRSEASHSSATASRGAAGADRETIAPKRVTFDGMNKSFQEQLKNNLDFVRGYFPISFLKDGKYEKLNTVEDLRNPEFQAYFPDISRIINLLVLTIQHRDFLPRQGEWLRSGTLAAVNIERQGDVTHMILRRDNLLSQPIKIDKATTPEQGIKALQEIGMSIDRQKVRGVELDLVGTDERFPKGLLASEYQILKQFNILQILPEVCSGTKVLASLARHYKDAAIDASLVRERARVSQECFYRHMIGTTSVIVITKKFFEEKKFLDRAVMKQLEEEMKKSSEKRQEVASPAGSNETTVTSAVNVGSERDIQGSTETVKEVPASTLAVIYSGGMNIGIQNRYLANNMRTAIRNFTESDRPCFSFYSISQARVMREHHLFSRKIAKNNEEYDAQKKKIKNLIDTLAGGPSELREPKNFHVWLDSLKKAMQLSTRITLVTGAKDIQDTEGDDEYLTKLKEYVNECKNKNIDLSAIVIVKNLQEAQRPTKRITDLISNGMTVHMVYVKDGASEDPENDIQNLREKQLQQLMDGQQPSTEDSGLGIMTYEPTKNEAKKEELSQKQENENKAIPSLASSSQ